MNSNLRSQTKALPWLILLPILWGAAGCTLGDSDEGDPQTFSVQFAGVRLDSEDWWVVVHDRTGDSVLAVQQVPYSTGFIDFGDLGTNRISCTFVRRYGSHIELESFINVSAGDWTEDMRGPVMVENDGRTEVTLDYPSGSYTDELLWLPNNSVVHNNLTGGQHTLIPQVFGLDHGRFTAFAQVLNPGGGYCGELLQAPYRESADNDYTVYLTESIGWHSMTTTRPCSQFVLLGVPGKRLLPVRRRKRLDV